MAVETKDLRSAAEHMRAHHGPDHPRHVFWQNLSEWLDATARSVDISPWFGIDVEAQDTARAYLDAL